MGVPGPPRGPWDVILPYLVTAQLSLVERGRSARGLMRNSQFCVLGSQRAGWGTSVGSSSDLGSGPFPESTPFPGRTEPPAEGFRGLGTPSGTQRKAGLWVTACGGLPTGVDIGATVLQKSEGQRTPLGAASWEAWSRHCGWTLPCPGAQGLQDSRSGSHGSLGPI